MSDPTPLEEQVALAKAMLARPLPDQPETITHDAAIKALTAYRTVLGNILALVNAAPVEPDLGSLQATPFAPGGEVDTSRASFQARILPWMLECFGPVIPFDKQERGDRLLEEVFELLQSGGYDQARVLALRDYVWGRYVGDPAQEVGGVMVTLGAYCIAHDLDMHEAGETELARIWTKVPQIRAKQAAKPTGSALPIGIGSVRNGGEADREASSNATPIEPQQPAAEGSAFLADVVAAMNGTGPFWRNPDQSDEDALDLLGNEARRILSALQAGGQDLAEYQRIVGEQDLTDPYWQGYRDALNLRAKAGGQAGGVEALALEALEAIADGEGFANEIARQTLEQIAALAPQPDRGE